ncbi:unnamed protein product [Ectocarpus sp. 12 AP-2014]
MMTPPCLFRAGKQAVSCDYGKRRVWNEAEKVPPPGGVGATWRSRWSSSRTCLSEDSRCHALRLPCRQRCHSCSPEPPRARFLRSTFCKPKSLPTQEMARQKTTDRPSAAAIQAAAAVVPHPAASGRMTRSAGQS